MASAISPKCTETFSTAAADVEVATPSVTIAEGAEDTLCVTLTATNGSPTSLADPFAVDLTMSLNADAGIATHL